MIDFHYQTIEIEPIRVPKVDHSWNSQRLEIMYMCLVMFAVLVPMGFCGVAIYGGWRSTKTLTDSKSTHVAILDHQFTRRFSDEIGVGKAGASPAPLSSPDWTEHIIIGERPVKVIDCGWEKC